MPVLSVRCRGGRKHGHRLTNNLGRLERKGTRKSSMTCSNVRSSNVGFDRRYAAKGLLSEFGRQWPTSTMETIIEHIFSGLGFGACPQDTVVIFAEKARKSPDEYMIVVQSSHGLSHPELPLGLSFQLKCGTQDRSVLDFLFRFCSFFRCRGSWLFFSCPRLCALGRTKKTSRMRERWR